MIASRPNTRTLTVALVSSFAGLLIFAVFWLIAVDSRPIFGSDTLATLAQNILAACLSIPIAIYAARNPDWKPFSRLVVIILVGFGSVIATAAAFVAQAGAGTMIFWPATIIAIVTIILWFAGFWFFVVIAIRIAVSRQRRAQSDTRDR